MPGKPFTDWKLPADLTSERRRKIFTKVLDLMKSMPDLSDADREFVIRLADQVVDDPSAVSLSRAFGFRSHGGTPLAQVDLLASRDALIVDGWRNIAEWKSLPPYSAGKVMSRDARRYEAGRWPHDRRGFNPPAAPAAALWYSVLRMGVKIPGSDGIRKILKAAIY